MNANFWVRWPYKNFNRKGPFPTMTRSWMNPIGNRRLTLVLSLLVLFTLLHSALVTSLRHQVAARLSSQQRLPQGMPKLQFPAEKNAAPFYRAAWELQRSKPSNLYVAGEISQRCRANPHEVQKQLKCYQASLQLLDQAHGQPFCDYQLHYEQGLNLIAPDFLSMRSLGYLLAVAAEEAKMRQDWPTACLRVSQGLRYVRTLEPNQSIIGLMIRVAISRIVVEAAQGIPPEFLSDDLRQEAQACSKQLGLDWERALLGESASVADCYRKLSEGKMNLSEMSDALDGNTWQRAVYAVGGTPLVLLDELSYLDWVNRVQKDPRNSATNSSFLLASAFTFNAAKVTERLQEARQGLESLAGR